VLHGWLGSDQSGKCAWISLEDPKEWGRFLARRECFTATGIRLSFMAIIQREMDDSKGWLKIATRATWNLKFLSVGVIK
jgi:hypothetical protein